MQEGDSFVSLRHFAPQENRCMSPKDKIAIFSVMKYCDYDGVDLHVLANSLTRLGLASEQMVEEFLLEFERSTDDCRQDTIQFIRRLVSIITFDDFHSMLKNADYDNLADNLIQERNGRFDILPKLDNASSEQINKFYCSLKGYLNSDVFLNKEGILICLKKRMCYIIFGSEPEITRQQALDKFAIITCLQVHLYPNCGKKNEILDDLKKMKPKGLNRELADFLYCIAKSWSGAEDEAMYYLDEAKAMSHVSCTSLEKILTCHTQALLNKAKFAKQSTPESFRDSTMACHIGMTCAVQEPDFLRQSWTRTFTVFGALVLLRIGLRFAVVEGTDPPDHDRDEAETMLQAAKRDTENWDSRREMMYQLCMASVVEKRNLFQAAQYCEEAVRLADDGTYNEIEKNNIERYQTRLQVQLIE